MLGAIPASPGRAADRAATVAAVVGGFPRTEDPIPEDMFRRPGGVGRRGAVCVRGCWAPILATAMAGAARESATFSSGISAVEYEREMVGSIHCSVLCICKYTAVTLYMHAQAAPSFLMQAQHTTPHCLCASCMSKISCYARTHAHTHMHTRTHTHTQSGIQQLTVLGLDHYEGSIHQDGVGQVKGCLTTGDVYKLHKADFAGEAQDRVTVGTSRGGEDSN